MNKKTLAALVITSSIVANPIYASNFIQKFISEHPMKKASAALKAKAPSLTDYTDFSGTWVGKCDGDEQEDTITIESSEFYFIVNGGYGEIGLVETHSYSSLSTGWVGSSTSALEWSADHSHLIHTNSALYHQGSEREIGYVIDTISIKNNQLIWAWNEQSPDGNVNGVCTFNKQ